MTNLAKTLKQGLDNILAIKSPSKTFSRFGMPIIALPDEPEIEYIPPAEWLCGYCEVVQPIEHRRCDCCGAPRKIYG